MFQKLRVLPECKNQFHLLDHKQPSDWLIDLNILSDENPRGNKSYIHYYIWFKDRLSSWSKFDSEIVYPEPHHG